MFDNVKKLIMTTNTGIVIKENKVKNWDHFPILIIENKNILIIIFIHRVS